MALPYNEAYIQTNETPGCGRQALNNLLGGEYFSKSVDSAPYTLEELQAFRSTLSTRNKMDLQRVCKYVDVSAGCPLNENYDASVLQTALNNAGFETRILGSTFSAEGSLGYVVNYDNAHWVSLHKNGKFTYKNSIREKPTTPGTIKIYDTLKDFIKEHGARIKTVLAVNQRLPLAPERAPEKAPAKVPEKAPAKAPAKVPVEESRLFNFLTGKAAPSSFSTLKYTESLTLKQSDVATPYVKGNPKFASVKVTQGTATELEFLHKLGLVVYRPEPPLKDRPFETHDISGYIHENAAVLYNAFRADPIKDKPTDSQKAALAQYLTLMRDYVLPGRLRAVSAVNHLPVTTAAGRDIATEADEIRSYMKRIDGALS